ncbi:hypothetical protein ACHAQA_002567 [Verticillium albo-atrum]
MVASRFPGYIPVGCLVITKEDTTTPLETQAQDIFHRWHILCRTQKKDGSAVNGSSDSPVVPPDLHAKLLGSNRLFHLFEGSWINLEYIALPNSPEVLRVHVLPDDVDHNTVKRSDTKLQKARRELFTRLDFSQQAWDGRPGISPRPSPGPREPVDDDEASLSLLEMFNDIPSPDPDPDTIVDPASRIPVNQLLLSEVEGLKTTLYPYQRRSTAAMAMREVQPGQTLDPRLLRVKDQAGEDWYYDAAATVVLREPRYYDSVQGGILAEQMGAGKTLICLSLILATKSSPTQIPAHCLRDRPGKGKIRSLADMAAARATAEGIPWRWYFDAAKAQNGWEYPGCLEALARNPGSYRLPPSDTRRRGRNSTGPSYTRRIAISQASLIVIPSNLLQQWQQEIRKHTTGLSVLVLGNREPMPTVEELARYDVVLLSHSRLDQMVRAGAWDENPLGGVHFKRCIVDEGHKLGNSTNNAKSNLLLGLDNIHMTARWIVTGTPSKGLYGVDEENLGGLKATQPLADKSRDMERADLARIGAIATLYLKARPWANSGLQGDKAAWSVYVMQPKHRAKSAGRKCSLRATLNSLIIRHRLSELTHMLPDVDEKTIFLDGSYQDKLSLNVFSIMIVANAVQSQRTDLDYFFHPSQRKALLQLVHNLKQASFFGGLFFSDDDIAKSLETATTFLRDRKVPVSSEDETLLRQAIQMAQVARRNPLKKLSNSFHEMPVFVRDFLPDDAGSAWSIDHAESNPVCINATLIMAAQKLIRPALADETALNSLLNGGLLAAGRQHRGLAEREAVWEGAEGSPRASRDKVLAGNTKLGDDQGVKKLRTNALHTSLKGDEGKPDAELEIPEAFAKAELVSTASAKMTYLLDGIIEHHENEQIIVFYENENTAWYVASMLDVIQYLIYAKTLTYARKAQYINTFNNDSKFRVLLMDITQAAFGLDMRAASRIYFLSPVLNPQVQAQAIGRVRRISQQKPVSVETLVLRGSIEEVIVERKHTMSQAEHWKCKNILDDRPIYNYILNAGFQALPEEQPDGLEQTARLKHPQFIFGRGFGRDTHPDEDIWMEDGGQAPVEVKPSSNGANGAANGLKRPHGVGRVAAIPERPGVLKEEQEDGSEPPSRRARFA